MNETDSRTSQVLKKISTDPGLPSTHPTTSPWQTPPHPQLATLQSAKLPEKVDVLIVGSGITAASIAHHLLTSDPAMTVFIAEARTLCSGATGRNGGHILELPYEEYDLELGLLGHEAAKKLIQFRLDHLEEMLRFAEKEMTEDARRASETRRVEVVDAVFDAQVWRESKAQLARFLNEFPEQAGKWRIWEEAEARKKFGMPFVHGAITGPAGALWPYRFITGVFSNLQAKFGHRISIETNTPVLELTTTSQKSSHPYIAQTSRGTIQAGNIVHATNGHAAHLLPRFRGKIFPIRGQMTVQTLNGTKPPPNFGAERSWLLRYSKGYDYLTQNPATGEYFLGGGALQGGVEDIGNPADDDESFLALCHLSGALPRLFGARQGDEALSSSLNASWTGTLGFSCDGRPWVGELPDSISERRPNFISDFSGGEYIAAGFCGSGMVYCWNSGRAIAAMILHQDITWFPEALLVTEKRLRASAAEDMAAHWLDLAVR